MTTTDVKALLNVNVQSPMRGWKKKRAAEDTSLEGLLRRKLQHPPALQVTRTRKGANRTMRH